MEAFDKCRQTFDKIGIIDTPDRQRKFVDTARSVARWGGINLPTLRRWERMEPSQLQLLISEARLKLNPATADTDDLDDFPYMSSGFSKIYSALIPGFPIYDSRVACALGCLVRLYCGEANLSTTPSPLELGMPDYQGNTGGRCSPSIRHDQNEKYAKANLQFPWLLLRLVEDPGEFSAVPVHLRSHALQSALFMLGYARLTSGAIKKPR